MINWTEYFLNMAVLTALRSKDPSTKAGAVIVDEDNTVISTGYNGFPRGMSKEDEERYWPDREEKYKRVVHAEVNAILNAGRHGKCLLGSTMYLTWPSCSNCAPLIVQAGIKKVVYLSDPSNSGTLQHSFEVSKDTMKDLELVEVTDFNPVILQRYIRGQIY